MSLHQEFDKEKDCQCTRIKNKNLTFFFPINFGREIIRNKAHIKQVVDKEKVTFEQEWDSEKVGGQTEENVNNSKKDAKRKSQWTKLMYGYIAYNGRNKPHAMKQPLKNND